MKTVRGNGNTVTTTWAARKASGNHGPTEVAQSRIWTAVGSGTSSTSATRITAAAAMAIIRRRGTCRTVAATAVRTPRSVLTTGFTLVKGTWHRPSPPGGKAVGPVPAGMLRDANHLA